MTQSNRRLIITLLVVFAAIGVVVLLLWAQREPRQERETSQKQESPQTEETTQEQEPPQEQETRPKQEPLKTQRQPQAPPAEQAAPPSQPEESSQEPPHTRIVVDVSAFRAQLNDYKDRNGVYPTTAQGLRVLGVVPPKDPWGNDYIYNSPSVRERESYDLLSAGPDGRPDTPDDDWGEEGQEASPTE